VHPSAGEIKIHNLFYDAQYYEDRAQKIYAKNPEEAIQKYVESFRLKEDRKDIGMKKGELIWLTQEEIPYIKAEVIKC
jgi:predicted RND superfamily exporter protein